MTAVPSPVVTVYEEDLLVDPRDDLQTVPDVYQRRRCCEGNRRRCDLDPYLRQRRRDDQSNECGKQDDSHETLSSFCADAQRTTCASSTEAITALPLEERNVGSARP